MANKMTKKPIVAEWMIRLMTNRYGSIEAAREAYKVVRAETRAAKSNRGQTVIWVAPSGKIMAVSSNEVSYSGSIDAYSVLPG